MLWTIYGLLHSIFRAGFVEANRFYGLDRWQAAFLQSLFGFILLLPFAPLMTWPESYRFYLAAGGVASIFTVGLMIQLGLSAQKSGRVSSVYMPLEALLAILIWALVYPAMGQQYMTDAITTVWIAAAFFITTLALLKMRPQDINLKTFFIVAPVGLTYAVAGVVTKRILLDGQPGTALAFIALNMAVMAVVFGVTMLLKQGNARAGLFSTRTLKAGLVTGLFTMLGFATFVLSVIHAPNPGYTSMLAMLLPVWLLIWHRFRRMEDPAGMKSASFLVLGVVLLVIMTI